MIRDFQALAASHAPVPYNPERIHGLAVGGGKMRSIRNAVFITVNKPLNAELLDNYT